MHSVCEYETLQQKCGGFFVGRIESAIWDDIAACVWDAQVVTRQNNMLLGLATLAADGSVGIAMGSSASSAKPSSAHLRS